jgi:hypothetical protein
MDNEFMNTQISEIKKYKNICCEHAGRDLGNTPALEWIDRYAAEFREHWRRTSECSGNYRE